jgi:hypothetical protein
MKPKPPSKPVPSGKLVQITSRMTPDGRDMIHALAEAEGLTVQQLSIFAWNLALHAYGRPPLPEQ